ncbi:glycine cleavage system protein GcvH [bacterium]|nr:glycine cleavage system protein GcvH [bacterium]
MYPDELKYTASHEWIEVAGDEARVGISDYAQHQLSDIVYVELPEVGRKVKKGEAVAVVESSKMAADCYSPLSGEIIAVNESLEESPELINTSPYGDGWLFRIRMSNPDEVGQLLDAGKYQSTLDEEH